MSYTDAINELRQMIADTNLNKRSTNKKLLGDVDASNKVFFTFDKKLISGTVAVKVNNTAATFVVDDLIAGQISLSTAPTNGQQVTASYYWTWWTDSELTNFLNKGAEMVGVLTSYLDIQPGLKNGALNFAASLATGALAQYLVARKHSGEFTLEQDGGDDEGFQTVVSNLVKMGDMFYKKGVAMRDDFYKSQGRQFQPAFGIKVVNTRQYGPRR